MKAKEKKKILVIEDEPHIADGLKLNLSLQGHAVEIAGDGGSGLVKWKQWKPDLIVLDIMLPVIDGFTVLRSIRLEDERLPVLILSAKGDTDDRVTGLTFGVDDYMAKPFDLDEFLLRVDRLLTRVSWGENDGANNSAIPSVYTFGNNKIDFKAYTAFCKTGEIRLTEQEIKILKLFVINCGKPLSRSKLLEIGWGYSKNTTTRTVDNFIVRFRKYFEDNPKKPKYFKSLRSVGYIFQGDKK